MKRIACLMLVVSIACAGCEVKESSTSRIMGPDVQSVSPGVSHTLPGVTRMPLGPDDGWSNRMGMYSELKERIETVEEVLSQIKIAPRPDIVSSFLYYYTIGNKCGFREIKSGHREKPLLYGGEC